MLGLLERLAATLDWPLAETEMMTPKTTAGTTSDVIRTIQEHVDREARNRRLATMPVRELCPLQKAELVSDLARMLR